MLERNKAPDIANLSVRRDGRLEAIMSKYRIYDGTPYYGAVGRHIANIQKPSPDGKDLLAVADKSVGRHDLQPGTRESMVHARALEIQRGAIGPPQGNALMSSAELVKDGLVGLYEKGYPNEPL
jgi:hypothetical protein